MEFSFDRSNEAHESNTTQSKNNGQNERLRKAIEKNRLRQEASLREDPPPAPKVSAAITRKSVAKPDDVEFTSVAKTAKKIAGQVNYTTNVRKKTKPINPKFIEYLIKGCWTLCVIMILRLIFANGGVTTFYSQRSLYSDRLEELDRIKKENMSLVHEIERMKTDTIFQKKLVRDNLGFIASDEYLVLFPKEK